MKSGTCQTSTLMTVLLIINKSKPLTRACVWCRPEDAVPRVVGKLSGFYEADGSDVERYDDDEYNGT